MPMRRALTPPGSSAIRNFFGPLYTDPACVVVHADLRGFGGVSRLVYESIVMRTSDLGTLFSILLFLNTVICAILLMLHKVGVSVGTPLI